MNTRRAFGLALTLTLIALSTGIWSAPRSRRLLAAASKSTSVHPRISRGRRLGSAGRSSSEPTMASTEPSSGRPTARPKAQ